MKTQEKATDRLARIVLLDPESRHGWDEAGLRAKLRVYVIADQFITFCERLRQKKNVPPSLLQLFNKVPQKELLVAYDTATTISLLPNASHGKMTTLEIEFIGGPYHACCLEFHIEEWGHIQQVAGTWRSY